MYWKQSNVTLNVSKELRDFAGQAAAISSKVSSVLGAAVELIDVINFLYQEQADPFAKIMAVIAYQLQDFIDDTFSTGMYSLFVSPYFLEGVYQKAPIVKRKIVDEFLTETAISGVRYDKQGYATMTPREAIEKAVDSFYDEGDADRPQFSNNAAVSSFGIMITSPSIDIFKDTLEAFNNLFNISEFDFLLKKLRLGEEDKPASENPDWQSLKLNSIEPLAELQGNLTRFLKLAQGYSNPRTSAVEDLIGTVVDKIYELGYNVDVLSDLLSRMRNATSATGVHIFDYSSTSGGIWGIQDALYDTDLWKMEDNKYTVFALFVGSGPTEKPIKIIKQLIG